MVDFTKSKNFERDVAAIADPKEMLNALVQAVDMGWINDPYYKSLERILMQRAAEILNT
jgi:hypothetical protein